MCALHTHRVEESRPRMSYAGRSNTALHTMNAISVCVEEEEEKKKTACTACKHGVVYKTFLGSIWQVSRPLTIRPRLDWAAVSDCCHWLHCVDTIGNSNPRLADDGEN